MAHGLFSRNGLLMRRYQNFLFDLKGSILRTWPYNAPSLFKSSSSLSCLVLADADSVKFCVGVPVHIHFQLENNFEESSDCLFFEDSLCPSSTKILALFLQEKI